ncbi:DNA repair protein RecO [Arcanobacterium phocae]|uniref:DNA repair protein RecO n=1 Tax=Arcanobacterium phocae TaxID=131112 RepID=UPI001C0F01AF
MKTYRDDAIVLRTHDIGEADRVITMLSRNHGKIRAVAKGVRKTGSRFGARVEPFSHVDVQIYRGKTLDTISQVDSIAQYGRTIGRNYDAYTAASALVELADYINDDDVPDTRLFVLLFGALHAVASNMHPPELVVYSFILRSMTIAGWGFSINECATCGTTGPHSALNIAAGGAVCDNCRPVGSATPSVETWQLLFALVVGDWAVADTSSSSARKAAGAIVAAYAQWHLEKHMKSLRLLTVH